MNILVISSCTSTKRTSHPQHLTLDDFRHPDPNHLSERERSLRELKDDSGQPLKLEMAARDMYTGRQHEYVVEGVDQLRRIVGASAKIDLNIVSAGYGLLKENDPVLPYEATFNGMRKKDLTEYVHKVLRLPDRIRDTITPYDLVFFLLGETYLEALDLFSLPPRNGLVFVAGAATRKWFPRQHTKNLVLFTNDDVKTIGGGQVGLKGAILKRFAGILAELPTTPARLAMLEDLSSEPKRLREMLHIPEQIRLPLPAALKRKTVSIVLPPTRAKNYQGRPRFFVPDWDDLVNPLYNFEKDEHPQGQFDPYDHGVYAHDLFKGQPCYDGVLISRAVVNASNDKKKARFQEVHDFLGWQGPVMGDCGAFSYLTQENPPYSTDDVLDYYERFGFNIGVSVDHLIVGKYAEDEAERARRFRLTLDNAADFLRKHRERGHSFRPMGIAQGWDVTSYEEAVKSLVEMGYKHIALGGLAFAKSQTVVDILGTVSKHFPEDLYVHVFGLAREELLQPYALLGVNAFDSATFLRRSWLSSQTNYLDHTTGEWYTAIRIPPSSFYMNTKKGPVRRYHREVQRLLDEAPKDAKGRVIAEVEAAEQRALRAIREYDAGKLPLPETLEAILAYDELVLPNRDLQGLYERTLLEKPWKRCNCPICEPTKGIGVEVIIFRQNDRNRRRGFHNTYSFKHMEEAAWEKIRKTLVGGHQTTLI